MTAGRINELYETARLGNAEAQHQLFLHLTERFRFIVAQRIWDQIEVEEVVQSAMLIVCREFPTLDVTVSFSAWAHKVLDNRILTHVRSIRKERDRVDRDPGALETAEAVVADLDLRRKIVDCITQIGKVNQQYVRVLGHQSQGYSSEEICNRMKLKENTFYSLLRRGRALLAKCLETGKVK